MRRFVLVCAFLFSSTTLFAQTATPASKLGWDQVGQTATVATAAAYTVYIDGATVGVALTGVTCVTAAVPANGSTCSATFPALTPGTHTLVGTQTISGTESAKTPTPFSFAFVVVVTPTGWRIVNP